MFVLIEMNKKIRAHLPLLMVILLFTQTMAAQESYTQTLGLRGQVKLVTQTSSEIITDKGSLAVNAALSAIRAGRDRVSDEGLNREAELFGRLCETRDAKEGTQAFLEKRPPHFRDQ